MQYLNKIILGNCKEKLKILPDKSVRCVVTSPPYYGLRDYGTATWYGGDVSCGHKGKPFRTKENINKHTGTGTDVKNSEDTQPFKNICEKCGATRIDEQIGLEETPEQFISSLVEVFEEVRTKLTDDGTLWVNIGDSYAAAAKSRSVEQACRKSNLQGSKGRQISCKDQPNKITGDLKPKDLIGIPWMLAFALRAAGWYLRQDIIWHKPNPMPESVTDRCTKSHEYIFLLSKSKSYYYDHEAIKTTMAASSVVRLNQDVESQDVESQLGSDRVPGKTNGRMKAVSAKKRGHKLPHAGFNKKWDKMTLQEQQENGANKRSVWTVPTMPFSLGLKTYHWRLLEGDAPSCGNLSIMSLNCPVYGGLFDLVSILLCDEHEVCSYHHKSDIDNYLSEEPKDGFLPIRMLHAWGCGGQSLDCFLLDNYRPAIYHNRKIHKTDLFVSTTLSCKPSDERTSYIQHKLTQYGLFGLSHDKPENNILEPYFDDTHKPKTLYCIVGKQELEQSFSYVQIYKKETKKESHFATFPENLIVDCIKAGSERGDIILDPFSGAGTTALVASKLERNFVGIELNQKYIDISNKRLDKALGLFRNKIHVK
jgi:DNA modification methylase